MKEVAHLVGLREQDEEEEWARMLMVLARGPTREPGSDSHRSSGQDRNNQTVSKH